MTGPDIFWKKKIARMTGQDSQAREVRRKKGYRYLVGRIEGKLKEQNKDALG